MNPALPKTLCKAIDMLGYAIKRKGGVNPALPKPNLCLYNFGKGNKKGKSRVNPKG
ncbi:MAG: hypothetical protein ISS43_02950 [Candidatus Omnitrophica bacterium]|nr:hypothetical protein [Candidatus Omnitrophota bacterium]